MTDRDENSRVAGMSRNDLRTGVFVWIFAMCTLMCQVSHAENTPGMTIRINTFATVEADRTLLEDISVINAPGFLAEEFGKIEVTRSPKPGGVKTLTKAQIESSLRSKKDLLEGVELTIPDKIYLKRSGQEIQENEVKQLLESYLKKMLPDGVEFTLERIRISGLETYPGGRLGLYFSGGVQDSGGRISLSADVLVDGEKTDRLSIHGWVNVFSRRLCATTDLIKGQVIRSSDVQPRRVNISRSKGELAVSMSQVEGKVLKMDFGTGDLIRIDQVHTPPVIRKGEMVQLVAQKSNLMITASGISREDGYMGEAIRVENLSSGKLIRGRVRERSTVEILY
ncbi:MAG: flagella basal body P-ring formation protein FlgA [Desulfobacteraceae bacterium]|nr:MAG: flagella basal body P-ring formation protein FlgA [Desulfobacteraceae bacterium]